MKRIKIAFTLIIVLLLVVVAHAAWSDFDAAKPSDIRRWDLADDDIRANNAALVANLNLADGGLVIGNTTNALEADAAGLTTEMLVGGGAVTKPVWTAATGSGSPVRATSPTLVTPDLGTPSTIVLTNATYGVGIDTKFYNLNLIDPSTVQGVDSQICIDPNTFSALTITEVAVTLDADPTTEINANLKHATAFIGLGSATLIVAIDTTNGTTDVDSGFNDATVPGGSAIYIEFDATPDVATTQMSVKVTFTYD